MIVRKVKLAVRRAEGFPIGFPAPLYIHCGCGNNVTIHQIKGMPFRGFECLCGITYDAQGWILEESQPATS